MKKIIRHVHTDQLLQDWLRNLPNELQFDAVGLWQIVPTLKLDFGLRDRDLEDAVIHAIKALFEAGAVPVRFSPSNEEEWIALNYINSESAITQIIDEWVRGEILPTPGDIWFAILP